MKISNNSFYKSFKMCVKQCLYYSLEKNDLFMINIELFENKIGEVLVIIIDKYDIDYYSLDAGYFYDDFYCKGVSLCLNYKIKGYYQKINLNYIMNDHYFPML